MSNSELFKQIDAILLTTTESLRVLSNLVSNMDKRLTTLEEKELRDVKDL